VSDGTTWGWVSDSILLYTSHNLNSWRKRSIIFTADQVPNTVRHRLLGGSDGPLRYVFLWGGGKGEEGEGRVDLDTDQSRGDPVLECVCNYMCWTRSCVCGGGGGMAVQSYAEVPT